jgi:hypothetical protein
MVKLTRLNTNYRLRIEKKLAIRDYLKSQEKKQRVEALSLDAVSHKTKIPIDQLNVLVEEMKKEGDLIDETAEFDIILLNNQKSQHLLLKLKTENKLRDNFHDAKIFLTSIFAIYVLLSVVTMVWSNDINRHFATSTATEIIIGFSYIFFLMVLVTAMIIKQSREMFIRLEYMKKLMITISIIIVLLVAWLIYLGINKNWQLFSTITSLLFFLLMYFKELIMNMLRKLFPKVFKH